MSEVEKVKMSTLAEKARNWNERHGDSKGRISSRTLKAVYDRGIGAYKTNPGSVRPNVKSKEQWAMARVNSFLKIAAGQKAASHDKDLLPEKAVSKALYRGKEVQLDKPFRLPAGSAKKFGVYVKSGDKVKKVTFGSPTMKSVVTTQRLVRTFVRDITATARPIRPPLAIGRARCGSQA